MVKTIGDAVMATFSTPDRAVAAALRMRDAMQSLNAERRSEDLLLKIGIHEGPCLAVAQRPAGLFRPDREHRSRVQNLAVSRSIFTTGRWSNIRNRQRYWKPAGLQPNMQVAALRGIADDTTVYEIP